MNYYVRLGPLEDIRTGSMVAPSFMAGMEVNLANVFGVLLITFAIFMWMYGVFCAQVLWYYEKYPDDRRSFKIMVALLWIFESVHSALSFDMIWSYLIVRGSINPFFLIYADWSSIAMIIPAEICVVIVDIFYILRMWRLLNKNKNVFLLFIPVVVGSAHTIGVVVIISRYPGFWQIDKSKYYLSMAAGCKVLTDIATTVTMCALLARRRSMITSRSRFLLKALFVWTLTTGLLTSLFTIVYCVTYLTMPSNTVYIGVYLLRTKICANAMLASLNTRRALRSISNQQIHLEEIFPSTKHPSSHGTDLEAV